jgi:uncharacterized membrane protein YhaH (DUF805 family)
MPTICFFIVLFDILLSPNAYAMPSLDTANNRIIVPEMQIQSLLLTPMNEFWIALGILFFILSIPYLFSMQIRRQHDLNLSGWWWIVQLLPLAEIYMYVPNSPAAPGKPLWLVLMILSTLSNFFSLYVTVWAGSKTANKYGEPPLPRTSMLHDVLGF